MSENDRKRTANFITEETFQLMQLVKKYKHIIECKQSDRMLWQRKLKIWDTVAAEFNASSGKVYREAIVLRKKYENLKKITKKKFADEKCKLQGTGGGPGETSNITPLEEAIKDLITLQVEGLQCIYDSDIINLQNENEGNQGTSAGINLNSVCGDTELSSMPVEVITQENNWSQHNPAMLQQRISKELQFEDSAEIGTQSSSKSHTPSKPKRMCTSKMSSNYTPSQQNSQKWVQLAQKKSELVEMQKQFAQEEHELKMKNLKEWHEIQMQIAKVELEKRRKELEYMNA